MGGTSACVVQCRKAYQACLLGAFWLLGGCGGNPASPIVLHLDSLTPREFSYAADPVILQASGEFIPRLDLRLEDEAQPRLDERFTAQVGDVAVEDVRFLNSHSLEIHFHPRTMGGIGTYPLTVLDPRGLRATLENAVSLIVTQPTHLAVGRPPDKVSQGQWSKPIRVELRDDDGNASRFDGEGETTLSLSSNSPTGRFQLRGERSTQPSIIQRWSPVDFEGFDFTYFDPSPGTWTLTIDCKRLPNLSFSVTIHLPVEPQQGPARGP